MTEPKHKTRIEYSDSDLVLHVCPLGHYRYVYHPIPDLPPADLAPVRTPPQGRKSKKEKRDKRPRPESFSPNGADVKNARVASPTGAGATDKSQAVEDSVNHHLN